MAIPAALMEEISGELGKEGPGGAANDLTRGMVQGMAEGMAFRVLANAKGVEAWDRVKYAATPDGKFTFEGVAYFPDFNQFVLSTSSLQEGASNMAASFRSLRDASGNWVIRAMVEDEPAAANAPPAQPPSPAEIDERVKAMRENWPEMRSTLEPLMKDYKQVTRIKVAGTIRECQGWQQSNPQVAALETDFGKILNVLGALIEDDAALRTLYAEAKADANGEPVPGAALYRRVFSNGEENATIVVTPGAPHFDYAPEAARAKAAMSDKVKELMNLSLPVK